MRPTRKNFHFAMIAVAVTSLTALLSGCARDWWKPIEAVSRPFEAAHRTRPHTGKDDAIEQLANEIDWLEHHIDEYGTIVAQHPSVWGESRLMRHRDEYETIMSRQLDQFQTKINATLRRSDQSFLASATALSFAISGPQATRTAPDGTETGVEPQDVRIDVTNALLPDLQSKATSFNPETGQITVAGDTNNVNLFRSAPQGLIRGRFPDSANLALEPTIDLDQRSRFLNHLHELRRINEGDDTADSPGYSLNLVRVPVSVLAGKKTRKGYGAEITITATPYLSPELLPTTFRNLVINDLVDQLAYPMTRVVNSQDSAIDDALTDIATVHFHMATKFPNGPAFEVLPAPGAAPIPEVADARDAGPDYKQNGDQGALWFSNERAYKDACSNLKMALNTPALVNEFFKQTTTIAVPAARSRRALLPFPPTQLLSIYDVGLLAHIAADARNGLKLHPVNRDQLHLMDVQAFLQEELQAAYEFLGTDQYNFLWEHLCPRIAAAVRTRSLDGLIQLRKEYMTGVGIDFENTDKFWTTGNTTKSLAWAILVESALLNERLNQDIKTASEEKGCMLMVADWLPFYGPRPPDLARMTFNEYVNCRWPIQVFALDPVTQDQNVADVHSRRRELQMALALGFVSGQVNAQNLTRFSRRLEQDIETIALNRTAVGFSHGNDTFGWRFQPRLQTPPDPGTFHAFGQTLFGGPGRDGDIDQREIETGPRECTALVVMPSFVPYCTMDTRTNWFKLTDPKQTEISMRQTMDLSRSITAMRNSAAQCAECMHLYRPGEVDRMLRRVHQLDRELPLQSMMVQIPYENTAGGFELFSSGITDLGPELIGFYGAPGINPNGTTTLFLVGDGFSVHDTRVAAGGQPVTFRLISRQLMEVQIPGSVQVLTQGKSGGAGEFDPRELDEVVDIHVATPYGVSSHLLVPVAKAGSALASPTSFELRSGVTLNLTFSKNSSTPPAADIDAFVRSNRPVLAIRAPRTGEVPATTSITFLVRDATKGTYIGSFAVSAIPFRAYSYQYVIEGSQLTDLVSKAGTSASLNEVVKPYIQHEDFKEVRVEVSARINNIPISGTFEAVYKPK